MFLKFCVTTCTKGYTVISFLRNSLCFLYNISFLFKKLISFEVKIRANDIHVTDAERFDSFSSVVFNCKKLNFAALIKSYIIPD